MARRERSVLRDEADHVEAESISTEGVERTDTGGGLFPRGNPELGEDFPTPAEAGLTYDGEITQEQRAVTIAEAAYYIAQRRGFDSGSALEDWLIAGGQIDALLRDP